MSSQLKMKMSNRCLYCYQPLEESKRYYHTRCSRAFFGSDDAPELGYTLGQMAELATSIVQRSVSVPGVQPKLSIGEKYILKPPHSDYPEMPANEHLTMKMAGAFGLKVVPSSLIRLSSGELAYITKRIDRTPEGDKIHMLDMFQILEAYDKYKGSMEKVGKAITNYAANTLLDIWDFFELTVFCFLTGNNDMHLKNFSMIAQSNGEWSLAPAYDLLNVAIVNPADKEELALTISARKSKFNRIRFVEFGQNLGLTNRQIEGVFARLFKNKQLALDMIDISFLSDEFKDKYRELLVERYNRLEE